MVLTGLGGPWLDVSSRVFPASVFLLLTVWPLGNVQKLTLLPVPELWNLGCGIGNLEGLVDLPHEPLACLSPSRHDNRAGAAE